MLESLKAAFLGVVEGVTEFLPVSSTGHLILFTDLVNYTSPSAKVFEVVIQLGAILAVCVLYFPRLWARLRGLFQHDAPSWRFAVAVIVAFLPAAVIGFLLHDFIKAVLFSPYVVVASLIVGGIIMIAVETFHKTPPRVHEVEAFTPMLALKIGLAQCLAMIPGVSRSGATIIGGMLFGADRKTATEFSFFLAIPTMFGATALDLWKARHDLTVKGIDEIAIGFAVSFVVALLVVRWFVKFVSTHDFSGFGIYRIIFGCIVLGWLWFHGLPA